MQDFNRKQAAGLYSRRASLPELEIPALSKADGVPVDFRA